MVKRVSGNVEVSRAEEWCYLVRSLDDAGIATLEGRMLGFGAEIRVGEAPLPASLWESDAAREKEETPQRVTLRLGMDGRLSACDLEAFSTALPHRLLSLALPAKPVLSHEEWPDPGLARPFAALLPLDLDARIEGNERLAELLFDEGSARAIIETTGLVQASGGPAIQIAGQATWDAERGRLLHRGLEARFTPAESDPVRNPGVLSAEIALT